MNSSLAYYLLINITKQEAGYYEKEKGPYQLSKYHRGRKAGELEFGTPAES